MAPKSFRKIAALHPKTATETTKKTGRPNLHWVVVSGKGMAHLRHIQKQLDGFQQALLRFWDTGHCLKLTHKRSCLTIDLKKRRHSPACLVVGFHQKKLSSKQKNQDKTDGLKKTNQKLPLPGILGMPLIFFPSVRVHPQTSFQKKTTRPHLPFHVSMISQLSAHAVSGKLAEIGLAN